MLHKKKLMFYGISTICTCLILALSMPMIARADGPEDGMPHQSNRQVGLLSTTTTCLAVPAGNLNEVSTTVNLEWEGQIDEAFLVVTASGSEGGHSLYVNGQRVGSAPVRPDGLSCQTGPEVLAFAPINMISLPTEILVKGENIVTLTNDANVNDDWTAVNLYLEIHGVLSVPPIAEESTLPALSGSSIDAMAVVTGSVQLTSSYNGVLHRVWYQIPNGYNPSGSPVPLLVGVHGYGGSGEGVLNSFMGPEADSRGWLFIAPNMHGNYYLDGTRALAWPGAQHDIIDAIEYMMANYNVDTSHIYIAGGSMGGQTTAMMAAKYPDIFAAAAPWKAITDLADWYYGELKDLDNSGVRASIRREIDPSCNPWVEDFETGCGTPIQVPFEYQRRSSIQMPSNPRFIPVKMWHDEDDQLVKIYHSQDLTSAINNQSPPPTTPVVLIEIASGDYDCLSDPYQHCFSPTPEVTYELFSFLTSYTLSSLPPSSLSIRTDESKPYYWLNIIQTGGDHWSEIEASYNLGSQTVTAIISDTQLLTVAFNLGTAQIAGTAGISQAGMGLLSGTYSVTEEGGSVYNYEQAYSSGYFTVALQNTGQITLTITRVSGGPGSFQVYLPVVIKNN